MSEAITIHNPQSDMPALPRLRAGASIKNPRLTVEAGLYAVIIALALAVRLFRLDLAPLSTSEAGLALASLHGTLPPAGASPLLTWLTALLFALIESSDFSARLAPAMAGTVLVIMPALVRDRIGRVGALGAAAVLAISPVAIMASRTASGDVIAAAVMLGLVTVCVHYLSSERAAWLYAGAAMLGLGVTSGRTIYSALLILIPVLGYWVASQERKVESKALEPHAQLLKQAVPRGASVKNQKSRIALIILATAFLTCATGFAWKPNGLGSTAELLSAWLADFSSGTTSWAWPFQVLAVYEMLAVVAGMIGLLAAAQRWDRFATLLTTWLVIATLLAVVRPGRSGGDLLLVVIPLTLLGGYAFDALANSLQTVRLSIAEASLILVLLPVIAYLVLGVANYANNPNASAASVRFNLGPAASLIQSLLAIALGVVIIALFGSLSGTVTALRGTTFALLIVLALLTWSAGWGATQVRPGDPRELITGPETTSLDVHDLVSDLARLSADKTTDANMLSFSIQATPDGVLGWYLRDMPNAHFVTRVNGPDVPSAFITTDGPPALSTSYAGHRYTLRHEWRIEGRPANDILKWLIYRQGGIPQPTQQAVLWIRQGQ